mmetsp:Transcript_11394/g.15530  ORF Transcript_11394/g.15530 Transcript_11394/m.15530 type:complete len:399 (-) Transcript_11394:82-1278(-)
MLFGVLLAICSKGGVPFRFDSGTALSLVHGIVDLGRNVERLILPLQILTGGSNLRSAESGTVDGMAVGFVGRTVSDEGGHLDECWLVSNRLGFLNSFADGVKIGVPVLDVDRMPAKGHEAGRDVLGERDVSVSVNRDTVVIVQGDELSKSPMSSERGSLSGDTLHVAAVSKNAISVVVHDGRVGLIEPSGQMLLSNGKADSIGNSLSKRTSGHLNSLSHEVLGVSRAPGFPLAESHHVLHLHALVSGQMKHRVVKHASVSSGENEAIPVEKLRVLGVKFHVLGEQDVRHGGATHGETRVSRVRLLYRVNGQKTDGVNALKGRSINLLLNGNSALGDHACRLVGTGEGGRLHRCILPEESGSGAADRASGLAGASQRGGGLAQHRLLGNGSHGYKLYKV